MLWNQYKYIAFNIFSCKILIILYKMLNITGIFNVKTNELTIYGKLCWNVTIFYRQELISLFQEQEKLKACRKSKLNFSSSCFIADDSHVNMIFLIFDIIFICLNIIQWKYLKITLILSITQIKTVYKFPSFRLH